MLTGRQPVFNTTWFDLDLLSTTGVYNEYGATRTFSIGDNVTLTEKVRYTFPNNLPWIAISNGISSSRKWCIQTGHSFNATDRIQVSYMSQPRYTTNLIGIILTLLTSSVPAEIQKPEAEGGGTFYGYWETLAVTQTSVADESNVTYGAYRCNIGDPFGKFANACTSSMLMLVRLDTATFHVDSINDAISVLTNEGLLTGTNVAPYTISS